MSSSLDEITFPTSSLVLKRLRPTYAPPAWLAQRLADSQEKWDNKRKLAEKGNPSKRIAPCPVKKLDCGDGLEARYEVEPWRRIGYQSPVQMRETHCGVFENGALLVTLRFQETRNSSATREMSFNRYLSECDAVSQALYEHSALCMQAKELLDDNDGYLMPKERLAEVSELWITPAARARLSWAKPLRMLVKKLFVDGPTCNCVVLTAFPLEYAKGFEERVLELSELLGEVKAEPVIERERYLSVRRKTALLGLYIKHLGFSVLNGADGSMYRAT